MRQYRLYNLHNPGSPPNMIQQHVVHQISNIIYTKISKIRATKNPSFFDIWGMIRNRRAVKPPEMNSTCYTPQGIDGLVSIYRGVSGTKYFENFHLRRAFQNLLKKWSRTGFLAFWIYTRSFRCTLVKS